MPKTEKEIKIIAKCRKICDNNNKEESLDKIKKEYPGCAISITMSDGDFGQKMFSGMFMWKNFILNF